MKTTTFCVLSLLFVASLPCFGFNYTITFTGSGASTTVGDVIVQNLTKGTSVTVPAGNILNLSDATAVEQLSATDETIHVYPNSVNGKSTVSFYAKQAGVTQINVLGLDGKKIAGISTNLQVGSNTFEVSLPKGIFAIQVTGNKYAYTAKMMNLTVAQSKMGIVYIGTEKPTSSNPQKSKSSALSVTAMTYATGDQLLYKALSGSYSTIVTDKPTGNKTTNFHFVACADADGNNYTTVTIGTQTWMVENLKTTKYNDGTAISFETDNTAWAALSTPAYCWYNNDATTYKNIYGALYNWYAVSTAKLAPIGWHVPTDAEWKILENYLMVNGYSYDGTTTGNKYAKSLAATANWTTSTYTGAIGNDLNKNNSVGFSALPGGQRAASNFGTFGYLGSFGYWWSATETVANGAWFRYMDYSSSNVYSACGYYSWQNGFSVRCLSDENVIKTEIKSDFDFSPKENLNNTIDINFSNTSQNATIYFWDFGDGSSTNIKNPTHKYTNSGIYKVILLAQNNELKDMNADGIINISDRTLPMDTISKTITIN